MFYSLATRPSRGFAHRDSALASNRGLEKFLDETYSSLSNNTLPATSVEVLEKTYKLELDVPGVSKDQLEIGIEGDVVRVSSKPEASRTVKAAWRFPLEIDPDQSEAKLENGVLTLTLGKKLPVSNVRQIEIK